MLSQYLETNTLQLIRLLTTLLDCQNISFSQLTKVTSLKSKTCRHLLGQLTKRLDGMVCIEINEQSQISCSLKERVSKNQCLHLIYRDSMVLSCLKFLIFNQEHQPFTVFSKNHFLSTASAYRVREKCRHFLKSVHLSIRANQVCGEEFRIRYLIALLQCQYGVSCYPIEEDDLDRITEFMTNSNPNIAKNFLSLMEDEFAFCHFLMMLTWKRQAFRPYLPYSAQFDHIKPLFIYPKIIHFSKEYLETSLPFSFDQLDYDYLFLVYCTNTNFFCGHLWNEKEREKVCQLVATKTDIAYLIPSFKAFLGSNLSTSLPFLEAMMTLFRKCLFNLQSLIPEEDDLEAFRHSPIPFSIMRLKLSLKNG